MVWKPGESGNPKGRGVDAHVKLFREGCAAILAEPGKFGGTMFHDSILTLLAPVIRHPPEIVPCATCGLSPLSYLVNDTTIANTLFRLAEHAHGKPVQPVDVKRVADEIPLDDAQKLILDYVREHPELMRRLLPSIDTTIS